ncbi:MAG: PAS domain S-box protein [Actinobacteria bacterium]|nr:PAS domain S-box protein [Actinomycetota bacterium]
MDPGTTPNSSVIDALLIDPELQYRFLVEESSDILAIHEPGGRLRWISPAVERVLGWTPQERINLHLDLIHPDDYPALAAVRSRLADGEESATARIRLLHMDGSFSWAASTARAVRDPEGRIAALVVVTRDVHEQALAEQALAEAEVRYRIIAENSGDVVLETSDEGVINWISPSAGDVLGWEPKNVLDHSVMEFVHVDDLQGVRDGAERVRTDEVTSGRSRVRRTDGSFRWFAWTQRSVTDADGSERSRVTSLRDIQAEVDAEKALADSREFYRLLVENTSDVVVRTGSDGRIEWVSPAASRNFGWSPDAMVGTSTTEWMHPDDVAALAAEAVRLAQGGERALLTFRIRRGDGTYLWVEAASQSAPPSHGTAPTRITRLRDVDLQVRAFEALAGSEEKFRSAMHNAGFGMCLATVDGTFLDVNAALCEILGRDEADIKALTWLELTHPDDLSADLDLAQQVVSGAIDQYRMTKRYLRPDGGIVFGDVTVKGVRSGDGALTYFIAQIVDVTEQVRARDALADSEEQFRLLLDSVSDVIVHVREGVIRWVSPSLSDALGWSPAEWMGRRFSEFLHPDDRPEHGPHVDEALAGETTRHRVRVLSANGGYQWIEVHARPFVDAQGTHTGVTSSFRVVDAEVKATAALARSEETFRTAMESAPAGMAVVDLDRRFVEVNPALCRMLDRDEAWLLSHRIVDILDPRDDEVDLRMRAEVLSGRSGAVTREKRLMRPDGSPVWVEHAIGLLQDDDGFPWGYVSQFVNITEARQAREELRFMATHDPLTRLVNRPELLTQMDRALSHQPRTGTQVAALFIDLDGLKRINDTFGHGVGDAVIVEISQRIRGQVRAEDLVARLGGDEFVVFLPAVHSIDDAHRIADKIQAAVAAPLTIDGRQIAATLSIGVSLAAPGANSDRVLEFADRALYRAKRGGRARTVDYDPLVDHEPPSPDRN